MIFQYTLKFLQVHLTQSYASHSETYMSHSLLDFSLFFPPLRIIINSNVSGAYIVFAYIYYCWQYFIICTYIRIGQQFWRAQIQPFTCISRKCNFHLVIHCDYSLWPLLTFELLKKFNFHLFMCMQYYKALICRHKHTH